MPEIYWRWSVVVDPYLLWQNNPDWVFRNFLMIYLNDTYSNELRGYWNAFFDLSNSRDSGMGLGLIKYETITGWLDENRIYDFDSRQEMRHYINFLDSVYLEYYEKKRKEKEDRRKKK